MFMQCEQGTRKKLYPESIKASTAIAAGVYTYYYYNKCVPDLVTELGYKV